ncbi:uncharacterized protein LOC120672341 isoform X2 [Panicum virgatum]|uniref:uncharacterized protein LOC120672341 isoform X2 n=1 Tax=Panicum virgatum TaxID=38727 RepID=UPI0019D5D6D7|nr:uncharacterized protein LOC120672341 isoform X2 [Panicum virgatum]
MMACRRLAREAVAASVRRGAGPAPVAPASAFSPSSSSAAYCSSRAPVAASPTCLNLLKGFGISSVLGMSLHQGKVTAATTEQPSKAITMPPPGSLINELGSFWSLVRKLQLPIGLMFLIVSGWQYPLGLVINILLLIYCSRPSRYSIYLFLQEVRHREMGQSGAMWKEEVSQVCAYKKC